MHRFASEEQFSFIKDHEVLVECLIASEMVDDWVGSGIPEVVCEVDVTKDYT